MLAFVRIAQNAHHQFEQGLMSQDVWDGYRESFLRMLENPGSRQWWGDNAVRFSVSFRTFLDSELERRAASQAILIAVKAPRIASLAYRNVAARLPPKSPDNEGI